MSYRVVHYINQFFAQIGGEEMAHVASGAPQGLRRPRHAAFNQAWKGEAEIVATDRLRRLLFRRAREGRQGADSSPGSRLQKPDLFIAGPAFNAGRYGYACANICADRRRTSCTSPS
jgi:glycine reductase